MKRKKYMTDNPQVGDLVRCFNKNIPSDDVRAGLCVVCTGNDDAVMMRGEPRELALAFIDLAKRDKLFRDLVRSACDAVRDKILFP